MTLLPMHTAQSCSDHLQTPTLKLTFVPLWQAAPRQILCWWVMQDRQSRLPDLRCYASRIMMTAYACTQRELFLSVLKHGQQRLESMARLQLLAYCAQNALCDDRPPSCGSEMCSVAISHLTDQSMRQLSRSAVMLRSQGHNRS